MSQKTLSAGDYIDARCTRCRAITNHTIVAMVEDKVVRVQCNTCDGLHNYRAPKPEKKAATAAAPRPKVARGAKKAEQERLATLEEWVGLSRSADPAKAVAYSMTSGYRLKDLIDHSVFGMGVVKKLIKPNKMEVLFQEGIKVLRCQL